MINEKNLKRKELRDKYVYYYEKNDISDNEHILIFLEGILKYLEEFEYEYDENFVFCGRKKFLYEEIIRIVNGEQKENDPIHFMLGSLNEFMRDDNFVSFGEEEAGIGFVELRDKNDLYSKEGVICKQEKTKIEEIINIIKEYINNCKEVNNVNNIEIYNEKYDIDPEDNEPQKVYGIPDAMRKQWEENANKKYDVDPEDNEPQKVYGIPDVMRKQWEEDANKKYDIEPEDNEPQKVYGIPDVMRKQWKEKTNKKYDIEPEDNEPQKVYGIPDAMRKQWEEETNKKYDIEPEDNEPQIVYGVPNFDYLDEEMKKENIDIVIENCCLSLTKRNNICDLLYVNKGIVSYSNDLNIFISFQKFDEFCDRLKTIIADWNTEYLGDSGVKWKLNIDINGLSKQINGNGAYPENWNELIDLLSEYEILFKNNLN